MGMGIMKEDRNMGWISAKNEGGLSGPKNATCSHHNQVGACKICAAEEAAAAQKRTAAALAESAEAKKKWRAECPLLADCVLNFSEIEDYDGETGTLTWVPVKAFLKKYPSEWRVRGNRAANDPSSLWLELRAKTKESRK